MSFPARGVEPSEPPRRLRGPSVSRESDRERLKAWREAHGLDGETGHNRKEHTRGFWAASKHGGEVTGRLSYKGVSAKDMADHVDELLAAEGNCIFIPSVRRLAVGRAFVEIVERFDAAGKKIVSHDDTETATLLADPGPQRELAIFRLAENALANWLATKTTDSGADHRHSRPEWQAVLAFTDERPDVDGERLARILEARGYQTLTGKTNWTRMQVLRARRELAGNGERRYRPKPP
jgi:hypothetical protein